MLADLNTILGNAVSRILRKEQHDRVDWTAYWPHARGLRQAGYSWVRIYDLLDTELAAHGTRHGMPGTVEQFQKAMSKRWHREFGETADQAAQAAASR